MGLLLSVITVNRGPNPNRTKLVYLASNGVHLDIIIPTNHLDSTSLSDLTSDKVDFISFGWGDENFYINTPTWGDLTAKNACKALFLRSTSLMHVTRHRTSRSHWKKVAVSDTELHLLLSKIQAAFQTDKSDNKIRLVGKGYGQNDDFYKANMSYSCLNTCNTWVNTTFKQCGLKACLWTPFDFGLLNKYQ